MERVKLEVRPRPETGTRPTKRLRREGLIPGVLYGFGKDATSVAVDEHKLRAALTTDAGLHAILDVTVEGKKRSHIAIVKDYQLDVVRSTVTHVDLQEIRLDEPIDSTVSIVVEGTAAGIKMGGLLDFMTHEVTVHGLPTDIPEHLTIDVTELEIGDHLKVGDLTTPEGLAVLDDPELIVCSVLAPRVVEEEVVEEAAAEAAQPELVGEGEGGGEAAEE